MIVDCFMRYNDDNTCLGASLSFGLLMLCEYEYDANGGANGRYEAARSKSNGADYAHDNEHNGQDNFNDFPSTQFCHRLTSSTCSGNSISYI